MKSLSLLAVLSMPVLAENKPLFQENFEAKELKAINDSSKIVKLPKAPFKKLGKILHIAGGTNQVAEIEFGNKLEGVKSITFDIFKWTAKGSTEVELFAKVNGEYKALVLDSNISTTPTQAIIKVNHAGPITALKVKTTSEGGILLDNIRCLDYVAKRPKTPGIASEKIRKVIDSKYIFKSGTKDATGTFVHTYRIPAIATALNGDLITVIDARRKTARDMQWTDDIDISISRSSDNGKTWSEPTPITHYHKTPKVGSDPALIVDKTTGEIFCFYNYLDHSKIKKKSTKVNYRFYVMSSKDHGKTWSEGKDITDQIKPKSWGKNDFNFITSGRGIQTRSGELLHTIARIDHGIYVFGSKDHGKTWYVKENKVTKKGNECKIVELNNGDLMINSRWAKGSRSISVSKDNGKSWTNHLDNNLVDARCNAAIIQYTSVKDGYKKNRLLFCNANSPNGRKNLAVKISYDDGKTWSEGKVIDFGYSSYSTMTILKDGSIGIVYESTISVGLKFVRITLEDLTDGKDKLEKAYELK